MSRQQPTSSAVDYRREFKALARRFERAVGTLRPVRVWRDPGISPENLYLVLPYYLAERRGFADTARAARCMAFANACGAAHFLAQDGMLDSEGPPDPGSCRLADLCMAVFVREYASLVGGDPAFWRLFDGYLRDYFDALAWERSTLWSEAGARAVREAAFGDTMLRLGHKMAPLKATVAAAILLWGDPVERPAAEAIVDEYHAAYQLVDDLHDLELDARAGRWSVALWVVAQHAGLTAPPDGLGQRELWHLACESGALERIAREIDRRYAQAASIAERLAIPSLACRLTELRTRTGRALADALRREHILAAATDETGVPRSHCGAPADSATVASAVSADIRAIPRELHSFSVAGCTFVLDAPTGLVFEADRAAAEVLASLETHDPEAGLDVARMNHGARVVREVLDDIAVLAADRPPAARPAPSERARGDDVFHGITAIALNLSDTCNLTCDYCYFGDGRPGSGAMSKATAFRAVELLFEESLGARDLSIVFFGGEPLLKPALLKTVVAHARRKASGAGRRVTFHVTTNGTLLTPELAGDLARLDVRVLVSIDGAARDHDRHRRFKDGRGSYAVIARNLKRLPPGIHPSVRVTVTPESGPLPEIVSHLTQLGAHVVHLAPVSGWPMSREFGERLRSEFEELAHAELARMSAGELPVIGQFIEGILLVLTGDGRRWPCGAGRRYLSVDADGVVYLCHRFAGDKTYVVGDVRSGVDHGAIRLLLDRFLRRAEPCRDCWAYRFCGGPCYHDVATTPGDPVGESGERCGVRRRIFELAMWIAASLPDDVRRSFIEWARHRARPELDLASAPTAGA